MFEHLVNKIKAKKLHLQRKIFLKDRFLEILPLFPSFSKYIFASKLRTESMKTLNWT